MKMDEEYLIDKFNSGKWNKLPQIKKEIAEHYFKNIRVIKNTMDEILERELVESEKNNLRMKSFDYALQQVVDVIKSQLDISEDDLNEMAKELTKEELAKVIEAELRGKGSSLSSL
tara:strand:+ start:2071 stop:2418 length:348 start_codon:yes stop_codon:yes gene_type:complete